MTPFGLDPKDVSFLELVLKKNLSQLCPVRIWIFGSRALGEFREYSDVDLLIECEKLNSELISQISECFEESSFPFKIDLVDLKKIAPEYEQSIINSRKLLFEF